MGTFSELSQTDVESLLLVEMLGIEPRSICYVVVLLRAQFTENCREYLHCEHQQYSVVSFDFPSSPLTNDEGKSHFYDVC